MRILHVEPDCYDDEARRVLEAVGEVVYVRCHDQRDFENAVWAAAYDALFVRIGLRVDDALLGAASSLRYVVTPTTGLDHIDLAAAERRGVRVVSLRGQTEMLGTISATAEHTWALLLALLRRIPWAFDAVRSGAWDREPFIGTELDGRTLGILGYGRLGAMVARYGRAFGMHVLAHDLDEDRLALARSAGDEPVGLDDLLTRSDVLSIHLPLNDGTAGHLDADRLRSLQRGAVLVNTSRGGLVDEDVLAELVRTGHVAGVAVDVLADDSTWAGTTSANPLLDLAQSGAPVLVSPHVGGYATGALARTRTFVAKLFADTIDRET